LIATLALSCLLLPCNTQAAPPCAENHRTDENRILLSPGATLIPLTLPSGIDLRMASRAGRRAAIILRNIRADAPTGGGFTVHVVGLDGLIGDFNTFSLVGKPAGEDRSFIPVDASGFLQELAHLPRPIRLQIDAPPGFAEHVTLEGADLVVE
jgi:hypothetical protein